MVSKKQKSRVIKDKILIVDDDKSLSVLVQKCLQKEGFRTFHSANCKQAFDWLSRNRTCLMLLDHKLPDMTGEEMVCQLAKENRSVPFVVISGQGDEHLVVEMMKSGALDYIVKDAGFLKLLPSVVSRAIEQYKQQEKLAHSEQELQTALEKSQQHAAEVSALLEASRAVLKYDKFEEVARAIFDNCKSLLGATAGYVALLSPDGKENEVLFLDSGNRSCKVDPTLPMPVRGLRATSYGSGKTVYENDFVNSKWAKFLPAKHVTLDNVLFAPLKLDDKVVGIMGIANKPTGFNENDANLASAFGEIVSVALHKTQAFESLEHSEERYRSVTKSAADAIISTDCSGCIVSWNDGAETIFGYSEDRIIGKPVTVLIAQNHRQAYDKAVEGLLSDRGPKRVSKTIEMYGLRKDGTEFPLSLSLSAWQTGEGKFYTAIMRDITEQKQAEEELKLHELRLQSLLDLNKMADASEKQILDFVLEQMARVVNSQFGFVGLMSPDESVNIIHAWSKAAMEECKVAQYPLHYPIANAGWWAEAVRKRKPIIINDYASDSPYKKGCPKGHAKIKRFLCIPVFDGERIVAIAAVANKKTDYDESDLHAITSLTNDMWRLIRRKQAEAEIENLAKFPSENPNPVLRITKEGVLLYANDAGNSFLTEWNCGVGQAIPEDWRQTVSEVFASGLQKRVEIKHKDKVYAFVVAPFMDAGYANLYGRDITEQKQAREALRKAHGELEKRVEERTVELRQAVENLQVEVGERIKAEQKILADQKQLRKMASELLMIEERERREIAVELHDSIGQILAFSSIELANLLESVPKNCVKSLAHVRKMIEEVITQTRTLTYDLSPTVLYTFGLDAAVEELAEQFTAEHGFECSFQTGEEPKPITKEVQILLYRAVRELLVNIAKHAQAGTVKMAANRVNHSIELTVEDDGVGFDLFSIGAARGRFDGLGLFSIRERLIHLGGTLDIKSNPGKGAKITLRAPLEESGKGD